MSQTPSCGCGLFVFDVSWGDHESFVWASSQGGAAGAISHNRFRLIPACRSACSIVFRPQLILVTPGRRFQAHSSGISILRRSYCAARLACRQACHDGLEERPDLRSDVGGRNLGSILSWSLFDFHGQSGLAVGMVHWPDNGTRACRSGGGHRTGSKSSPTAWNSGHGVLRRCACAHSRIAEHLSPVHTAILCRRDSYRPSLGAS